MGKEVIMKQVENKVTVKIINKATREVVAEFNSDEHEVLIE